MNRLTELWPHFMWHNKQSEMVVKASFLPYLFANCRLSLLWFHKAIQIIPHTEREPRAGRGEGRLGEAKRTERPHGTLVFRVDVGYHLFRSPGEERVRER